MTARPRRKWTIEEYLAFERASQERHEFIGGEVYQMAGATRKHSLLVTNCVFVLEGQLRKRPCEVYSGDMRVRIPQSTDYVYPDVIVVCDNKPHLEDNNFDTLLNPAVIIEVLSSSTEQFDRRGKFQRYQMIESLREYILISQDMAWVERCYRTAHDAGWQYSHANDMSSTVELTSIGARLPLEEVYLKVTFDPE
jgi:Uma2 family endonuclease